MTQLLTASVVETGTLAFGELVQRCRDEIHRFRQRGPGAGSSACMELFRRAVVQRDEQAWSAIYDLYRALVQSWLREIHYDLKEPDVVVHEAFARFACAFTAEKLARSESLGAVFSYLKRCTTSAALDEQRRLRPAASLEALLEEPGYANEAIVSDCADDPADQVIACLSAQGIWQMLQQTLKAREQALLALLCQGMTPIEIYRRYPHAYPSVGAIYQMQRALRRRFNRDGLPLTAPAPSRRKKTPSRSNAKTPVPSKEPKVGGSLLTQPAADSPHGSQRDQQSSEPKIHYHLQLAFCGKARCRKCREGRGHGPYWYEYRFCEGHTIKRYIGKTLPSTLLPAASVSGCE
jgi:DNA-directed RNA polymerase specialized sigma24 family protein